MQKIKLLGPNVLPMGIDCGVVISAVRVVCLLAILGIAGHAWAQKAEYTIETNSPESWSDYYMRTGLGAVDAIPLPIELTSLLAGHCRWLTEHTDHDWFPLGYSVELGYKLCYRTGPFSAADAAAALHSNSTIVVLVFGLGRRFVNSSRRCIDVAGVGASKRLLLSDSR